MTVVMRLKLSGRMGVIVRFHGMLSMLVMMVTVPTMTVGVGMLMNVLMAMTMGVLMGVHGIAVTVFVAMSMGV
jgi:hypothetical protein